MIRNRNLFPAKMNDSSPDADKYFQLPVIAVNSTGAPTASTAINGSLYWDEENDVLYICKAGAWAAVTVA